MSTKEVSIIIVNWNTCGLVRALLHSLNTHEKPECFEVVLVDNGSTDGSVDVLKKEFPQIILVENESNQGFAKAVNQGVAASTGRYIYLVNSDCIWMDSHLEKMIIFHNEHEMAGVLGSQIREPNKSIARTCRRFPKPIYELFRSSGLSNLMPIFDSYRMKGLIMHHHVL